MKNVRIVEVEVAPILPTSEPMKYHPWDWYIYLHENHKHLPFMDQYIYKFVPWMAGEAMKFGGVRADYYRIQGPVIVLPTQTMHFNKGNP